MVVVVDKVDALVLRLLRLRRHDETRHERLVGVNVRAVRFARKLVREYDVIQLEMC